MSLQYLLDGYNIIHQIPALTLKALEDQRLDFIRAIEQKKPQGSLKNKVIVVFDGKPGYVGQIRSSIVKVIFSQEQSADDRIKNLVQEAKNKKNIVVVTDDRAIQYAVKALGAKILGVQVFLAKLQFIPGKKRRGKKLSGATEEGKQISEELGQEITSELKDIWLKEKNKER